MFCLTLSLTHPLQIRKSFLCKLTHTHSKNKYKYLGNDGYHRDKCVMYRLMTFFICKVKFKTNKSNILI